MLRPQKPAPATAREAPTNPATGLRTFGRVWVLIALLLLTLAAVTAHHRRRIISSWPQVEALVTASSVQRSHATDGTLVFRPKVEFRYAVGGRQYVSSRVSESSSGYAWACRQAAKYSPGTRHRIKYDPSDPSQIRFDAAYTLNYFLAPIVTAGVGILVAVLGLAMIRAGKPRRHALCPSCGANVAAGWRFCAMCSAPLGR